MTIKLATKTEVEKRQTTKKPIGEAQRIHDVRIKLTSNNKDNIEKSKF